MNEFCHEVVFRTLTQEQKEHVEKSPVLKYTIALGSGIIAGFAAAILSQVRARIQDPLDFWEPDSTFAPQSLQIPSFPKSIRATDPQDQCPTASQSWRAKLGSEASSRVLDRG